MENESKHSTTVDYLDFELEIGRGSGQCYPVRVLRSVAGEANEIMDFPFSGLVLENRLLTLQNALLHSGGERRRIPLPEEQAVQRFGQALFEALFTGEVRSRYAVSQREALSNGRGLRVKLRIQSPLLAVVPWEFLYDPEQAEYVCLSRSTPLVRYLELPSPPEPLTVALPLRILGMIASPGNLVKLDIEREQARVERALEPLRKQGAVRLTWLKGQTWEDLQRAMWQGPWHVFHFIGHGGFDALADEGLIALSDEEGQANLLNATQVGRLLADHRSLRLVVLNACEGARGSKLDIFSSTAATLVRRGIPAVLAMQYEITDQAAIELSRAFYEAVVDGMPVDAALTEARKAVSLAIVNTLEWGTPILYMRSPNGVLFHMKPEPPSHQITSEAASASSFMRKKTVLPPVPREEAPAPSSTTPPTKDIPLPASPAKKGEEVALPGQLSQPKHGQQAPTQIHQKARPTQLPQVKKNLNLRLVLAVFLLLVGLISGSIFFFAKIIPAPPIPTTPVPACTTSVLNKTCEVDMRQTNFDPQSVTISVGDSINLINEASVRHFITNGTWVGSTPIQEPEAGAPTENNQFDSPGQNQILGPFDMAGTFHYFCTLMPGMNLTVTVQ